MLVSELHIYPIKSCAGISLQAAQIEKRGFQFDRRWMVVDKNGLFLTQRQYPQMTLIEVALQAENLLLKAPGMDNLLVPLSPPSSGKEVAVQIWRDQVEAIEMGSEFQKWFSSYLKIDAKLVYFPENKLRTVDEKHQETFNSVGFADQYPFLLISQESLDDLNHRLKEPISMRRFRPNIVIRGTAPYAEDHWKQISIGNVEFKIPKRCSRCTIPTVDPKTGTQGKEPLRTLALYRREGNEVFFGVNAIHKTMGQISIGDHVTVLD